MDFRLRAFGVFGMIWTNLLILIVLLRPLLWGKGLRLRVGGVGDAIEGGVVLGGLIAKKVEMGIDSWWLS